MIRDRFTDEERHAFYNAILFLDNENEYVITDKEKDTLSYTDKIKSYEAISGKPNDEELTIWLILLNLIKN